MNHSFMYLLLIFSIAHGIAALSIDCDELYDDESLSRTWGYIYYSCNGTVIADRNNSDVSELFGLHKHGRNNSHVDRIMLTNQNLTLIPTNLGNIFPHLKHIVLSSNNITRLTNSDLKPIRLLTDLLMDNNKITYLEGNLFDGLENLLLVNLSMNKITHIDHGIKLPMRLSLHLQNNTCIDERRTQLSETSCFTNSIWKQCAPLSNVNSSGSTDISANVSFFIDHTQMKEPEPITERPDFEVKAPKFGEVLNCFMKLSSGLDDEKCKEMIQFAEKRRDAALKNVELVPVTGEPFLKRFCDSGEWKWAYFVATVGRFPFAGPEMERKESLTVDT